MPLAWTNNATWLAQRYRGSLDDVDCVQIADYWLGSIGAYQVLVEA
jgi:hypothetical protein